MPGVETEQLIATCGHSQTGSPTVFADSLGISRVGLDTAIGTIQGPGSQTVFIENLNLSLPGDVIAPHPPCPIVGIHCAALTNPAGSPTVFAATGFSAGGGGQPGGQAAGDLKTTFFQVAPTSIPADMPPSAPIWSTLIPVVFAYAIKNEGDAAVGDFTIGLWKTPDLNDDPTMLNPIGPFLLTREGAMQIGATLIDTQIVQGLEVGETYTGAFTHQADDEWSNLLQPTWFAVYPDIDAVVGEIDEANWVDSISVTVT